MDNKQKLARSGSLIFVNRMVLNCIFNNNRFCCCPKRRKVTSGSYFTICLFLFTYIAISSFVFFHYDNLKDVQYTKYLCSIERKCNKHEICVESRIGNICVCDNGFYRDIKTQPLKELTQCRDIDECKVKAPCSEGALCVNTIGSFKCVCKAGYRKEGPICKKITAEYKGDLCKMPIINPRFSKCQNKIEWMKNNWKTHKCYGLSGVDGSLCSIIKYLSEIEDECPLLKNRKKLQLQIEEKTPRIEKAAILDRFDKDVLTSKVLINHNNFKWIKNRIELNWNDWVESYKSLTKKEDLSNRKSKKVYVFIGMLTDVKWGWANAAKKGGPLGELVQWTDLIVSLYLLGHEVIVPATEKELVVKISEPCHKLHINLDNFDIIFTDVRGLDKLQSNPSFKTIKCKLRVIDTFGTEARFNYKEDFEEMEVSLKGSKKLAKALQKNPYGYGHWQLHLKQFLTMFPHSPDNSFLGFTVAKKTTDDTIDMEKKEHQALVYGKKDYMWKDRSDYLSIIKKFIPLIGTVAKNIGKKQLVKNVPKFVKNNGFQTWKQYQDLLKKMKIYVGLGFPFEGPAPLEAIAKGAVFINPKYDPPLNRLNDVSFNNKLFFQGKPTIREVTSQHPYMEEFIGKPHVYTVNMKNAKEMSNTIQEIIAKFKNKEIKPYLPFEFTHEGMLQRVNSYIENQNFCNVNSNWPPKESLRPVISEVNESCKKACHNKGLVCDNGLFKYINNKMKFMENKLKCSQFDSKKSLLAPYLNTRDNICILQSEDLLYSCVDAAPTYIRICPCRDFIKGQVALCPQCIKAYGK